MRYTEAPVDDDPLGNDPVRETYEEYELGGERVALIADPQNSDAWIQSTVTRAIEQ